MDASALAPTRMLVGVVDVSHLAEALRVRRVGAVRVPRHQLVLATGAVRASSRCAVVMMQPAEDGNGDHLARIAGGLACW
jgi:hypothetical protein